MFELVIAFIALSSATIFLAHAVEAFLAHKQRGTAGLAGG
jgi:hypothetical protein